MACRSPLPLALTCSEKELKFSYAFESRLACWIVSSHPVQRKGCLMLARQPQRSNTCAAVHQNSFNQAQPGSAAAKCYSSDDKVNEVKRC